MAEFSTVLESIEYEIGEAFREFGLHPTHSARVRLRGKLITFSSALEVESNAEGVSSTEAAMLRKVSTDLLTLAEAALVAPVESLLGNDAPVKEVKAVHISPQQKQTQRFIGIVWKDFWRSLKGR